MVNDTDARAVLKKDRVAYWVGVGAQPSEKVAVLIRKYGENGTHLQKQADAIQKLSKKPVKA
jgi:small subunit ribosomal protein S16